LIFTAFPKVVSVISTLNPPLYTTFLLFTPLLPTFFPLPPLLAPPESTRIKDAFWAKWAEKNRPAWRQIG
jgi:hypothetical protein